MEELVRLAVVPLGFGFCLSELPLVRWCTTLSLELGSNVSYPGNAVYTSSLQSYFSAQEEQISPRCVVTPTSAADVAAVIKTLNKFNSVSKNQCTFAIRGGGHSLNAGAANIAQGVTIDMRSIKAINVNADRSITSIGAGAIWSDVYLYLDAMGLAVSGGRVANVGVGGLTTGGGISFFSPRYGLVCDNVENYEIVLASGQITNANANENADLWLALKGGSNNFGIVTRFDMRTFQQGKFWGGAIVNPISTLSDQLQAFANLNANFDPYAAIVQSFAFKPATGYIVYNNLEYTKEEVNPPALQPFTKLQPQYLNTMRISNLTDFTIEEAASAPSGFRQTYSTTTFQNSFPFLQKTYDLWNATIPSIANVPGLSWALTFQPIPVATTSKSAPLGGNSLGLDPTAGPLVLCLVSYQWSNVSDDVRVAAVAEGLLNKIDAEAKKEGLFNEWKYLNYAAFYQDPIKGYGPANKEKLQRVSKRYDPQGLFQTGAPGGFKLFT